MDADVIVLGAGFAGLSAADALRAQGREVLVVEARDRVGGRTRTDHLEPDVWVDLGGQWAGPGHSHLYALAERLGRAVFPMYQEGRHLLHLDDRARYYRGLIPWNLSPLALLSLGRGFLGLEWLCRRVPVNAHWQARNAARLDQQTLGDWMRRNLRHPQAFFILQVAVESVFAAHPDDISLLHALHYLHAGGGLEKLTSSAGGAQQDRIEGGMQGLAESWSQRLCDAGLTLRLEQPVRAVVQEAGGVRVHTDGGELFASRVISTLPPALSLDVEFRPGMPEPRRDWCRAMVPGRVIKCFAVYDRPFWREAGLSGFAVGDRAPVHVTFDACTHQAERGILLGFIEGREAAHWQDASEARREAVLACFARYFGEQARDPRHYLDHAWATEEWSRGCYAGVPGRGGVVGLAEHARAPHDRVHWAGTETASHWTGYIEGAIRSGLRAAEEVIGSAEIRDRPEL